MAIPLGDRFKHAWNAFRGRDRPIDYGAYGASYGFRPDRLRLSRGNERSIVTAIYNRIALDVAANTIQHVQLDEENRFQSIKQSGLNEVLTLSANLDQTGRALMQDIVMSMFDEGCVAIVPVDTTLDPQKTESYDIQSLRTGQILDWYPAHIRVRVYNEETGQKEDIILPKSMVAIIENPFYAVMNEPNSILKRLIRKLNLLDAIDEQSGSGKLDIIIQLPYIIKSEARKQQAAQRRIDLEEQLSGSKYGVGYIDGTEKVIQLNRPAENNLMKQIEFLTEMFYNQLGLTPEVFNGTADEKTMLNYYNRSTEPILAVIVDEMRRKFLTKTARTRRQTIMWFNNPFKLVPVASLAEIADKFTRNEILSPNEIRAVIGREPSKDKKADELRNRNINASNEEKPEDSSESDAKDIETSLKRRNQNGRQNEV